MIPNKRKHTLPPVARNVIERAKRAACRASNKHAIPPMRNGRECDVVLDFTDGMFYVAFLGDGGDECARDAINACERVLKCGLEPLGYDVFGDYDSVKDAWMFLIGGSGQRNLARNGAR